MDKIQFAAKETAPLVRRMWKQTFDDTDEFLDLFFDCKYKDSNTLIYITDNVAAASLQMLPYEINFYGEKIPFAYLAGLCTLPEYRKRGYMAKLIRKAHQVLTERNIPLSILVPAEEWLFGFYEKYGYEKVFDKGEEPIYPLKAILDRHITLKEAYKEFNTLYANIDFCVQKSYKDFQVIVKEQTIDKFPPKYNIAGMARITDVQYALNLYAKRNKKNNFRLKVTDDESQTCAIYYLTHGEAKRMDENAGYDIVVDAPMLCRLLFGYRTSELDERLSKLFAEHNPMMNLMLE